MEFDTDRYISVRNGIKVLIKIEQLENQEATALMALQDVTQISKLVETFELNHHQIIVTRYVEGITLDEYLENSNINGIHIANQLIKIIKDIHDHGWVHGDIHTHNIIVDNELNITVIDFGTAFQLTSPLTPLYPPPEALLLSSDNQRFVINPNYRMDYKYDYWALGLVIMRIFTNDPIPAASNFMLDEFPADQIAGIYQKYSYRPELPIEINQLIGDLLAHDPAQRQLI